ncbi:hypothetical protein QFZ56_004609 [Streptomyces achromogenes]|uniref:Uncharacterized protein n=1 Tax=Streptomyces achromogenes TaxID=67255 RepID=A0ABU0Q672_STRAH|nr:hypothetical protein [Streptomyces achromogenes]MDQ0685646.1 hypothetical protein [Streptomyces achromogenes]
MTDVNLEAVPDWRDPSAGGGLVRAAAWLLQEVGEGGTFTKERLRADFPGIAQIDRRVRDLRDYGWIINTSREDPGLGQAEQRFVKRGLDVWDPEQRKNRAVVTGNAGRVLSSTSAGEAAELDVRELAAQATALTARERIRLLAWITMGDRPQSAVERLWGQYLQLSAAGRQELAFEIARLVDQDTPEPGSDTPVS